MASGQLAAIEDRTLRSMLATVPTASLGSPSYLSRIRQRTTEILLPFLAKYASLAQISNKSYVHGRAGDGWGADPEAIVPLGRTTDDSSLLTNREFEGVLIASSRTKAMFCISWMVFEGIDELIKRIDKELANTT